MLFRVSGLGLEDWVLRFEVWTLGVGFAAGGLRFGV